MKTCSYCGRQNTDDAANCSGCGLTDFERETTPKMADDWVFLDI